ncbi:unnamed protein product, partial [Amoebophrya sp. A120]
NYRPSPFEIFTSPPQLVLTAGASPLALSDRDGGEKLVSTVLHDWSSVKGREDLSGTSSATPFHDSVVPLTYVARGQKLHFATFLNMCYVGAKGPDKPVKIAEWEAFLQQARAGKLADKTVPGVEQQLLAFIRAAFLPMTSVDLLPTLDDLIASESECQKTCLQWLIAGMEKAMAASNPGSVSPPWTFFTAAHHYDYESRTRVVPFDATLKSARLRLQLVRDLGQMTISCKATKPILRTMGWSHDWAMTIVRYSWRSQRLTGQRTFGEVGLDSATQVDGSSSSGMACKEGHADGAPRIPPGGMPSTSGF